MMFSTYDIRHSIAPWGSHSMALTLLCTLGQMDYLERPMLRFTMLFLNGNAVNSQRHDFIFRPFIICLCVEKTSNGEGFFPALNPKQDRVFFAPYRIISHPIPIFFCPDGFVSPQGNTALFFQFAYTQKSFLDLPAFLSCFKLVFPRSVPPMGGRCLSIPQNPSLHPSSPSRRLRKIPNPSRIPTVWSPPVFTLVVASCKPWDPLRWRTLFTSWLSWFSVWGDRLRVDRGHLLTLEGRGTASCDFPKLPDPPFL